MASDSEKETSAPSNASDEVIASETVADDSGSAAKLEGWRLIVVELCLCFGLLFSAMDSSIVSTALVTIGSDFQDFVKTIWIVLGYLLSYMAFAMLWARFSDMLGRKTCVIAAWCIFTAFSIGCGFATSLNQLIAFRTLQGLGGGGLYSLGNVVMPEITPNKYYSVMTGAQGAIFATSSILGPVLGGVIAKRTTWRWIFYLNIPFGVIVITILFLTWPSAGRGKQGWSKSRQYLLQFDYQASFLLIAASVLLILGLQSGGSAVSAWNSSLVICALTLSGFCWISLVAWTVYRETRSKQSAVPSLFPFQLLKIRNVSAAFLITVLTGFPLFLAIVSIPERYQVVNSESSLGAGVRMIPLLCASAVGSTGNGLMCARKNLSFYSLLGANCLLLLGSGLLSSVPHGENIDPAIYGYQVIFGLGVGGTLSATTITAGINSNFEHYALAAGIVNQARILGGAIGLACSTIVLNIRFGTDLQQTLSAAEIQSLRQTLNVIPSFTTKQQVAVQHAFAHAFSDQFRVCMYIAVACVILSLCNYSKHPVSLKKRLEYGEAVSKGRIPAAEGDRLVRARD